MCINGYTYTDTHHHNGTYIHTSLSQSFSLSLSLSHTHTQSYTPICTYKHNTPKKLQSIFKIVIEKNYSMT